MSTQSNSPTHTTPMESVGAWSGGSVIKVALSPTFAQDGIALAATLAGLFRSQDHGQRWQLSMDGIGEPTLTTVHFAGSPNRDAATAFAGTEGGRLYRSRDMGVSWEECTAWAGLGVLNGLAAAPDFDAQPYLFAATIKGAFRSLDGGESWESCTFGLLDDEVLAMIVAPDFEQSELVWCGTGGGGFYRSRNAAKAWREAGWGLPDSAVQALAVSPNFAQDRTLYAGLEDGGLYTSTDGGENWSVVGRATEPLPGAVNSLALLPAWRIYSKDAHATQPDQNDSSESSYTILAGTNWGVFWSIDGGNHWEAATGGDFIALDFAPSDQGTIIAGALSDGLFISADRGATWSRVGDAPAAHAPPLISAPTADRLFALDHDGVMAQSWDGGASWSPPPGEFEDGLVADMAVFSLGSGQNTDESVTVYVAGESGLLRGQTRPNDPDIRWEEIALPTAAEQGAPLVVVSPTFDQEPALLWGHYSGDMYLSTDGGESWALTARPWGGDMTLSVAMSPGFAADRRMVAIAGRQAASGHFGMTIWQSLNAGESWTELASLETETPAMLTALPKGDSESSIFLATRNRLIRLFTAAGEEEMQVHQTIFDEEQRVTALAVSPNYEKDQTVFAGIDVCIQSSQDRGVTWQQATCVPEGTAIIYLAPQSPHTGILVVSLGGSVWRAPWPGK